MDVQDYQSFVNCRLLWHDWINSVLLKVRRRKNHLHFTSINNGSKYSDFAASDKLYWRNTCSPSEKRIALERFVPLIKNWSGWKGCSSVKARRDYATRCISLRRFYVCDSFYNGNIKATLCKHHGFAWSPSKHGADFPPCTARFPSLTTLEFIRCTQLSFLLCAHWICMDCYMSAWLSWWRKPVRTAFLCAQVWPSNFVSFLFSSFFCQCNFSALHPWGINTLNVLEFYAHHEFIPLYASTLTQRSSFLSVPWISLLNT